MPGPPGASGRDGLPGTNGAKGDTGLAGPPGPAGPHSGGAVYTRWGSKTCPNITGTQILYDGRAGKSHYLEKGGGTNYQCLPNDPEYTDFRTGVQDYSYIYGVEYEFPVVSGVKDHNAPCAVCYISTRTTVLMIPAKLTCPSGWTKEYCGYLMTEWKGRSMGTFECVDINPASVPGSGADVSTGMFHHVEANCNGMPCPPYDPQKELTCVVCSM